MKARKREMECERESTEDLIRRQFVETHGVEPNLENPQGLSEKLNWLKLQGATELQTHCADKITAPEYVAAKLGPEFLVPRLMATYQPGDINPAKITAERFVVKTNHDYGCVSVCTDRANFPWAQTREKLALRLSQNHWYRHREPVYRNIRPGIIVEEMIESDSDDGLREYKFFCFNGRPEFVMAIKEGADMRTRTLYDPRWNRLPVSRKGVPTHPSEIPAPKLLSQMLAAAAVLAQPFPFCRVDLYENFGKILFGELTFYPEGGLGLFEPSGWELYFGGLLDLPKGKAPKSGKRPVRSLSRKKRLTAKSKEVLGSVKSSDQLN
ncbi:ATP-grasp fold amidoligase family protein [Pelagicoccus albus]|uniref:TupA-like ATPgrasp n=1 Tax=Pelagicoccus albus TaxID=415222 RepID=A0A7X1E9N1_9BACT|nr:ATP-grasp fold amidoligase family protein [Pelagicoccus albus]MBC2605947.1 hypothetical protein [Pelagicoccus albus]